MANRVALGAAITVLFVGVGAGGVWWQRARASARVRAALISAAEVELQRDPVDRGGLVQADRDLAQVAATDPDPSLLRARARIALLLRLPEDALRRLDDVTFLGRAATEDLDLRSQALALRHALGGRIDDARRATTLALEHFESTHSVASLLLAWQCATRVDDRNHSEAIADRLQDAFPDAWENRVVQALRAFDPERVDTGATLRRVHLEGASLPELDTAIAVLDVIDADESVRARGVETIARVLGQVPSSKPARLVAVLAYDRLGDVAARNAHLRWLVTNFPQDERVSKWHELLLQK